MYQTSSKTNHSPILLTYLITAVLCLLLAGCDINITVPNPSGSSSSSYSTSNSTSSSPCQSNCTVGSGVHGVQVFVEPNAGERVITDAINAAQKSVWLEIYLLSDRNVIRALEDDANRGLDVRVMLEPHPFGGGSPTRTIDQLTAAGIKAQETNPAFSLTHEKGIPIVRNVSVQL